MACPPGPARTWRVGLIYLDTDSTKGMDKWVWRAGRAPTSKQERTMVAMVLWDMVEFIMGNHLYQFNGKVYLQVEGGPIGLLITGVVASIVMMWFDQKLLKTLLYHNINVAMYKRYVDDVNSAVTKPQHITIPEGVKEDQHMAKVVREVANTILPSMITMVEDSPSDHTNGRLPILDMECWVNRDNNTLMHTFYQKTMASKVITSARSALQASTKKSIILAEGNRRLLNCSPSLPWTEKAAHLTTYNIRMKQAGHTQKFREQVTTRILKRYESSLHNLREHSHQIYRNKEERELAIQEKGGKATSSNWFKSKGYNNTLTLPATKGEALLEQVRKQMGLTMPPANYRTLLMEDGGHSIKLDLISSNIHQEEDCSR